MSLDFTTMSLLLFTVLMEVLLCSVISNLGLNAGIQIRSFSVFLKNHENTAEIVETVTFKFEIKLLSIILIRCHFRNIAYRHCQSIELGFYGSHLEAVSSANYLCREDQDLVIFLRPTCSISFETHNHVQESST